MNIFEIIMKTTSYFNLAILTISSALAVLPSTLICSDNIMQNATYQVASATPLHIQQEWDERRQLVENNTLGNLPSKNKKFKQTQKRIDNNKIAQITPSAVYRIVWDRKASINDPAIKKFVGRILELIEDIKLEGNEGKPHPISTPKDMQQMFSRRISKKDRLIYSCNHNKNEIVVYQCKDHYKGN